MSKYIHQVFGWYDRIPRWSLLKSWRLVLAASLLALVISLGAAFSLTETGVAYAGSADCASLPARIANFKERSQVLMVRSREFAREQPNHPSESEVDRHNALARELRAENLRIGEEAESLAREGKECQSTESKTPVATTGQIRYGEGDLSEAVISYRITHKIFGTRNVAAVQYTTTAKNKEIHVEASRRGVGHAERLLGKFLEDEKIDRARITQFYSELQPCNLPGAYCASFLAKQYPGASVTWSFPYGDSRESRREGVAALAKAVARIAEEHASQIR